MSEPKGVNEEIKFAAAEAIARIIKDDELHEDYIIPSGFDRKVVSSVAHAVAETAKRPDLQGIKPALPSPLSRAPCLPFRLP